MDLVWFSNHSANHNWSHYTILEDLPELEALSRPYQIILIVIYSVTALTAFIGNAIAVLTLLKGKKSSLLLRKYLISLAFSDLVMATFSIPFSYTIFMYGRWVFHPSLCSIVLSCQLWSVSVSIYTLAMIGIDRYFAIINPLHSRNWIKSHPILAIILIWVSGLALSSSMFFNSDAVEFRFRNNTYYDCIETWDKVDGQIYTIFLFIITFLFPLCIITYVYIAMSITIFKRKLPNDSAVSQSMAKRKIIKLLLIVVQAFVICWTPMQLFMLIVWLFPIRFSTKAQYNAYVTSYFVCHWLSMAHSSINPIIYSFLCDNFKTDFKIVFGKYFGKYKFIRRQTLSLRSNATIISDITNASTNLIHKNSILNK